MIGNIFRWFIAVAVLAIASGSIYYEYQNTRPCVRPIPYAIGSVDARFGIAKSALLSDVKAAAAIWNKAEGKTILAYDPTAALTISLIYDARQANAKLGSNILLEQSNLDAARVALDSARAQYVAEQTAYNEAVDTINSHGGATPSEAKDLEGQRAFLNQLEDAINSRVTSFNASVAALNAAAEEYNQSAGHTFEEGEYVRDSAGERISIFEFTNAIQLERVLAHELGHTIGLGHNDNPKSIMYAQNESGNLAPTAADLTALHAVCGA